MYMLMSLSRGLPVIALLQGGTPKKTIDYIEAGHRWFFHHYQLMLRKEGKHDENVYIQL